MNFRGFRGFARSAFNFSHAKPSINMSKAPKKINAAFTLRMAGMETVMQLTRIAGLPSNLEIANLRHRLLQRLSETLDADVLLAEQGKEVTQRDCQQRRSMNLLIDNIDAVVSPMSIMNQNILSGIPSHN